MESNYDGYILNKETIDILVNLCNDSILSLVKGSINSSGKITDETNEDIKKWKFMLDRLEELSMDDYYIGLEAGENVKNLNMR